MESCLDPKEAKKMKISKTGNNDSSSLIKLTKMALIL